MICSYDSGSMYGNVPMCDRPATHVVVYGNGSYGPFRAEVCGRHLSATEGRVYPGLIRVESLAR